MDCTVHGILQARILEWVAFPFPRDLPNPEIESRSPALQEDSLPTELPGKPKNNGVNSLSLLQQIFPTQELNPGLLHCKWILYQLNYQGSHLFLWNAPNRQIHTDRKSACQEMRSGNKKGPQQLWGFLEVRYHWVTSLSLFTFMHWRRQWQPTPGFLPGESQGRGSLVGCYLWGRTESDTTEAT